MKVSGAQDVMDRKPPEAFKDSTCGLRPVKLQETGSVSVPFITQSITVA